MNETNEWLKFGQKGTQEAAVPHLTEDRGNGAGPFQDTEEAPCGLGV